MSDNPIDSRQEAAELFGDAVRRYVDSGPVDLQEPADALVDALDGHATTADIATVLDRAAAVVARYWSNAGRGDQRLITAMAKSSLDALDEALFAAVNGFDRQGELVAAEEAVRSFEAQEVQARTDLERAVAAGDLEAVLALRGASEVTIPGKLGDAREKLLGLRLEAARAQLDAAVAARERKSEAVAAAQKARDDAAEVLRRRADELTAAQGGQEHAARNEAATRARIAAASEALNKHQVAHRRAQQSRIRQLAGLAPTAAA